MQNGLIVFLFLISIRLCLLSITLISQEAKNNNKDEVYPFGVEVTCEAINSCEVARYLFDNGFISLDGDNDGIPCENVCR